MTQFNVYGMGNALVDTEVQLTDEELNKAKIDKGLMVLVDEDRQLELLDVLSDHIIGAKRASGGSVANSMVAITRFGGTGFFTCKVALDENGDFYLNDMREAGVKTNDMTHSDKGHTGKCFAAITPDAERSMLTHLGISEGLSEQQLDLDALKNSEYLYIEGYLCTSDTARAATIKAKKFAEENGVKTAITLSDPGIVQFFEAQLKEIVGTGVDLILCNDAEAMQWTGKDNVDDAAEALKADAKTFAMTMGENGALVFDGETQKQVDTLSVEAIDTLGAGDMFAGGFLYGITNGMNFEQAGSFACKAAAKIVSQHGPRLRAEQYAELAK